MKQTKTDLVHSLTEAFEAHANRTDGVVEFWLARDVRYLLGYSKWDNFLNVVSKAQTACEVSGHSVPDHSADVGKIVDLGSGSQRQVDDIMLTRDTCYLISQDGEWPVLLQVMGKDGKHGCYLSLRDIGALFVQRRLPARMRKRLQGA